MVTREKSRDISGSYQAVFEACVRTVESFEPPSEQQNMMGVKRLLRIQSANAQAGTITAKLGEAWSLAIQVAGTEGRCIVSVKLLSNEQRADPLGGMFRWIDEFFEALMATTRDILAKGREHFD
jgi:hypothetical protein